MNKKVEVNYQTPDYLNTMLGRLFSNLPGFAYRCLFDEHWTMEFMSEGCHAVTGYAPDEVILNKKISYSEIIFSEDRKIVLERVKEGFCEKKQFSIEYRIVKKSGELVWVWERGICTTEGDDKERHIEGYITEINDRKMNEIELHESQKMYQDLVQLSPDGIIIVDLKAKIHNVNKAFCEMSGYLPEDFIGKIIFKIPTLIRSKSMMYKSIIKSVFSGKKKNKIHFQFKNSSGNIRLAEGRVKRIEIKGEMMIMGIVRDITDQDDERRTLINSKMKAEALLNASPDMMFVFDRSGMIMDYKADPRDLFDQNHPIISKHISEILPKNIAKQTMVKIKETLNSGEINELTYDLDIPGAGKKYFEARIIESGHEQVTAIIRDVTKRTNMERSLVEAKEDAEEGNRLKSAFLANMNHEIRTPMNAIMGFSNLLKRTDDKEKRLKYLDLLNTSSNYLLRLIDDVILYSRLQSEKISVDNKNIDLESILDELYNTVCNSENLKDVALELTIPKECRKLSFIGDKEKLWEIMNIYLNNAIKYTVSGFIRIGVEKKQEKLRFYVKDSGCGIPETDKEKVFQRFYRSDIAIRNSINGTGLGLSIAKELARIMKAEIGYESTFGEGSYFYFDITFIPSDLIEDKAMKDEKESVKVSDLKILVAEDDEASIIYMKEILKDMIKEMKYAKNGKEAVEMSRHEHYDCILMDIKMPLMTGLEATRIIRAENHDIPIVAQTAFTQLEEKQRVLKAGASAYLSKPIDPDELKNILSKLCKTQDK